MLLGGLSALAAGASFAAGGVLQQRAASDRPADESLSVRLILSLARQPRWLAGVGVAVLSYIFQALALSAAPLSVVQPLLLSELLFAVPVSVRLHHKRLRLREWLSIAGVAGGLAAAIATADPSTGNPIVPLSRWIVPLAILLGTVVVATTLGRLKPGTPRATMFALAASVLMGLEAAFMAGASDKFKQGPVAGFTSWEPYAMAVCSVVGLVLIQSAFQAGPLAASVPIADTVQPLVAIVLGLVLFGEHIESSAWRVAVAGVGVATVVAGIISLDTSPLVRTVQRQEQKK